MKYPIMQFLKDYPSDEACLDKILELRYGSSPACPGCNRKTTFHRIKKRRAYACQFCGHHIYPCVGTPFEKSRTSLRLWFYAMYLFTATRHGVSGKELERQLGVTYKTAWRMADKLRELMKQAQQKESMSGHVEVDEAYFGGRSKGKVGRGAKGKTPVLGMAQRKGRIKAMVVPDIKTKTILPLIRDSIEKGTTVYSDQLNIYDGISGMGYDHKRIMHSYGVYVRGDIHTNTVEGFWSLMKRSIRSTHIHVSRKHLPKYISEFSFRYNNRKQPNSMFERLVSFLARQQSTEY